MNAPYTARFVRGLHALRDLFYPNLCIHCYQFPRTGKLPFCLECGLDLPYVYVESLQENHFLRHFYGRIPVRWGTALFYFHPDGKVQTLLHALKYENRPEIGLELGKLLGRRMGKKYIDLSGDFIIPVPLHPKKKAKRGYNQSERFAQGLSLEMDVPVLKNVLIRTKHTTTQTGLDRLLRQENVASAFTLRNQHQIQGKHVVLVDDVLTTGATLESCALQLLAVTGVEVSIMTIAMGKL